MRVAYVALCLAVSACVAVKPKPINALAPVQTLDVPVVFLGQPYDPDILWVCSGLGGDFSCVSWVEYERVRQGL